MNEAGPGRVFMVLLVAPKPLANPDPENKIRRPVIGSREYDAFFAWRAVCEVGRAQIGCGGEAVRQHVRVFGQCNRLPLSSKVSGEGRNWASIW
jgi:hypothetical protein